MPQERNHLLLYIWPDFNDNKRIMIVLYRSLEKIGLLTYFEEQVCLLSLLKNHRHNHLLLYMWPNFNDNKRIMIVLYRSCEKTGLLTFEVSPKFTALRFLYKFYVQE